MGKQQIKSQIIQFIVVLLFSVVSITAQSYKIVDTGQNVCYDSVQTIPNPPPGSPFYGQDANYSGNAPSYVDNGDGTVTDLVTGLMWQKSPDRNGDGIINYDDKLLYDEAVSSAATCSLAGFDDWRLPIIKEQYSLIMYYGSEPNPMATSPGNAAPFIDTSYFEFGYGDLNASERIIDAQYATSTIYVSTTMGGNKTMFGVNFADGRIKGYPAEDPSWKKYYVLYVRGNTNYGTNDYVDNGDGTITDNATGLMWKKNDNGLGVLWENALSFAENSEYAGHMDWRLPNAKELHSIVDYSRSPDSTNSPSIDSVFSCTQIINDAGAADYPFYWSNTTFSSKSPMNGSNAVYLCFGRAMGYMAKFGGWIDVHGAGAQRSDPKVGDPANFPYGHGPQGDAIRIFNYIRLVRDDDATGVKDYQSDASGTPNKFELKQNYPNPFNPNTTIQYSLLTQQKVLIKVYDIMGKEVAVLVNSSVKAGTHQVVFDGSQFATGLYFYKIVTEGFSKIKKMILLK